MTNHTTESIRNLALLGHSGAGKTSLLEALLVKTGMLGEAGSLERGTTVSDHGPLEKDYQHSLYSAVAGMQYDGVHINIIDTPGLVDFRGQALPAMDAVETSAVVINAQSGIELATRRMLRRARIRNKCRIIVINKIDADGLDLEALVRQIREELGNQCLPVNLPTENYSRVLDCFFNEQGDTDIFSLDAAHAEITDQVIEVSESLMDRYLEGEELPKEELHDAFEQALREGHLVPICFVSAKTGAGLGQFLKLCKRLLPNPTEGNPPPFLKGQPSNIETAEPVEARPDPDAHVIARVFKIINDPFVGKLAVFRIYQGTINADSELFIGDNRKPFKVNHLFSLQGGKYSEIARGVPGDICAVAKVDDLHYGSVLHDSHDEDELFLQPLDFPQPMLGLALELSSRGQEQKLADYLHKLSQEDPCLLIEHNQELNETVMRGLGDMHLRVSLERLKTQANLDLNTRPPRIAYRETITRNAEGHYRHKKQTGGAGQFGEVFLRVQPLARGEGFRFVNKVVGGSIPTNLIPAVEKGVRQVLDEGAIAGYHVQDVEVTVYDGKYHPVDSKEIAFLTAGKKAFLDAIHNARPQVLEPVVTLNVVAPEQYMGDITGSLASRRARISGSESMRGGMIMIEGEIPLSELQDYQVELKSLTGGQGTYDMEFSHYDPVPASVQQDLINGFNNPNAT